MQIQPTHYFHLLDHIKAFIEIGWKHITPQFSPEMKMRKNTLQYPAESLWQKVIEQKKKIIFMNFPSPELAVKIQQNYEQLLRHYLNLLDCDYEHLHDKAETIKKEYIGRQLTLFTQENSLEVEIIAQMALSFAGSFQSSPYLILPAGKVEFEINRVKLNGIFKAEKCYYESEYYDHVSIQFEQGEIRFVDFSEEKKGNFILQNALMNSKRQCFLSIGINPGSRTLTNYYSYDRCIDGNLSFKLLDSNSEPILFSNRNTMIKKI
jgi:leucyl aminopeptidase (aminopeptidase T)